MLIKPFNDVIYVERNVDLTSFIPHIDTFKSQIEILLSQPYIHIQTGEQDGSVVTTAARQHALKSLEGYSELIKCLYPYFYIARDSLCEQFDGEIKIHRAWLNVMNRGSSTLTHNHKENSIIGVFYLNATVKSGKFVVVDDNRYRVCESDICSDKKHYVDITPYMLICHRNSVFHAVSRHDSDESRVSIIIEALLE